MPPPDAFIALIPAYNEAATVGVIVAQIRERWGCPVVVIDDCSTDDTARIARSTGATVLPLTIQLGAWGAIQTGLRYALQQGYRTAVTLDADGQHEPESIGALLEPLANDQADVSIQHRRFPGTGQPRPSLRLELLPLADRSATRRHHLRFSRL